MQLMKLYQSQTCFATLPAVAAIAAIATSFAFHSLTIWAHSCQLETGNQPSSRNAAKKQPLKHLFQEISNRTHWTDPWTRVSNRSSNLLRGPLVRSHLIFDGPILCAALKQHGNEIAMKQFRSSASCHHAALQATHHTHATTHAAHTAHATHTLSSRDCNSRVGNLVIRKRGRAYEQRIASNTLSGLKCWWLVCQYYPNAPWLPDGILWNNKSIRQLALLLTSF